MGRTSASLKASGGEERRPRGRPSNQWKRPTGPNADGAPTVRNIIPWQDMETKLAERLAEKAARGELSGELESGELEKDTDVPSKRPPWKNDVEPAPDSGVRASEVGAARELTYSVYTVADLDSRAPSVPPRMSMAFAPAPEPPPSRWADTGKAALALLRILWAHVRAPKPRPRLRDVAEVPSQLLLTELGRSLRAMPWKRIATGAGIALGTFLALLAIVLTVAELTDDLKPARATTTAPATDSAAIVSTMAMPATPTVTAPAPLSAIDTNPVTPAPPALSASAETIEIDDATPTPAKPKPKAKKPAKKKKAVELFKP
ncbi:MAG: hypothetical protein KF850_23240 [Labilithrix sp.]|nr:hypothetical protein [Labilithrix sp.]MBX3214968.1 hypothetical protein [Labilithrix sp.]